MDGLMSSSALWAMHPAFLDAALKRGTLEAMLPEAVRSFMALGATEAKAAPDPVREGAIVVYPVMGTLAPSGLGFRGTPTDVLADRMREFAADPKIGTIILRIRSPGGLIYGTAEAGDAIYEARQSKPVIAVADPFAFSAAYWLGSQATAFYASTSGEVGSVGVRSGHTDMSGFEDKIGMKTTLIASDPQKVAAHPYSPLSDEDRAEIQAGVDESNAAFVAAIARGRGTAVADVPNIHGKGAVFSARAAVSSGAIDGIMTLRDVISKYSSSRARLDIMRRRAAVRGLAASI